MRLPRLCTSVCLALSLSGALGCQQTNPNLSLRTVSDSFEQAEDNQVDILWVIDNSGSMQQEQEAVALSFDSFISEIEATGVDFHIGVITTDMSNPDERGRLQGNPRFLDNSLDPVTLEELFAAHVQVGIEGSRVERGLSAALTALRPPLSTHYNDGFLRDEALLLIITVSDENDCSDGGNITAEQTDLCVQDPELLIGTSEFVEDFQRLKDDPTKVIFSAVVFTGDDGAVGCGGAAPGLRYIDVAEQTGGVIKGICDEDYGSIMEELGLVATGVRDNFPLSRPALEESIEVRIREAERRDEAGYEGYEVAPAAGGENGWSFDVDANAVTLLGTALAPRGSEVIITYQISRSF